MHKNKSGFLSAVTINGSKNATVHYQCKSCLSFLASTTKWDRHLSKCFLKSSNSDNGGAPRPVGFRMVSFTDPFLLLKRVKPIEVPLRTTEEPLSICSSSSSLHPTSHIRKRKRGRPRKIFKVNGLVGERKVKLARKLKSSSYSVFVRAENGHIVKKRGRGRPRKILPIEKPCKGNASTDAINTSCPDKPFKKRGRPRKVLTAMEQIDEMDVIDDVSAENLPEVLAAEPEPECENGIRKSKRPKKQRTYVDDLLDVDEEGCTKFGYSKIRSNLLSMRKCFKKGVGKLGRPKKAVNSTKNANSEKTEKKSRSAFFQAARKHEYASADYVRSYKLSCHLCPGKFQVERDHRLHMNIHNGSRRLMECCVCRRIFNKRDSLNQHYLAHEAAEAREETFKLFQPWDKELLEKVKVYRGHSLQKSCSFNRQQTCKACLLQHYTHHSFLTHFTIEHSDPPESYSLACKFGDCELQFKSIRLYLEHAKTTHPEKFYGKLTLTRKTRGIFIGTNRVVPVDKDGNLLYKQRKFFPKEPTDTNKIVKANTPGKSEKRVSSFTPSFEKSKDPEGSDWEEECGLSLEESDDENEEVHSPKRIEVERVHLHGDAVKKEINFSEQKVKLEEKEEIILPDIIEENLLEPSPLPLQTDSEPVVFGVVKGELLDF